MSLLGNIAGNVAGSTITNVASNFLSGNGLQLTQIALRPDPAPGWRWSCSFNDQPPVPINSSFKPANSITNQLSNLIGSGVNAASSSLGLGNIVNSSSGPRPPTGAFVESISLPLPMINQISRFCSGKTQFYAGHYQLSEVNVDFYETDSYDCLQYFTWWQSCVVGMDITNNNPYAGNFNTPNNYKRNFIVSAYDYSNIEVMRYILIGAWPLNIGHIQYVSDYSERIRLNVTFSLDDIQYHVLDPLSPTNILSNAGNNLPSITNIL